MWRGFKAHQHGFPSADSLLFDYRGFGNGTYLAGVGQIALRATFILLDNNIVNYSIIIR
jgi:hypothetical protein